MVEFDLKIKIFRVSCQEALGKLNLVYLFDLAKARLKPKATTKFTF